MNNINTDKAWKILHNRLEEEGLIAIEKEEKQPLITLRRIAAAILLFGIVGSITYYVLKNENKTLLSQVNNNPDKTTLVTTLQDGSIVYLSEKSSLYYPEEFDPGVRKVKITGSALFDISKDLNRPFYVETELVSVKVLGTEFGMNDVGNKTAFELFVERGKVEVTNKQNGESVFVEAGEIVRIKSGHLLKQKNYDQKKYTAFTNRMSFKDERLEQILKVIQNTTDTTIVVEDRDIANSQLTVTFENNSVESMIQLICYALNLNYIQKKETIYISKL